MDPQFIEYLKKWLKYDTEINNRNKQLNEMRKTRSELEDNIIKYMTNNNLTNKKLNVGSCSLVYNKSETISPLNMDLITEVLNELFKNKNIVNQVLSAIVKKRNMNKKHHISIKRRKNRKSKRSTLN